MKNLIGAMLLIVTGMSMAQIPAGYYDAAQGQTGANLKSALNSIIKGHTEFPYSASTTDTWDILKETDPDPNNPNNVIGLYSNFSMDAAAEYNGGQGWTREHVWAKSRGDFGTSLGAGTDIHHLRPEDASTNSARSNRNFDEATTPYVDGSGLYSGPTDSYTGGSGAFTWEPRAAVKGDVARMLFYMATRYEGEAGEPDLELTETLLTSGDKSPVHAKLSVLLTWHIQDPVDTYEQNRNDVIYGYQGNRNPFIDHPEYVEMIWGVASTPAPSFTSTPVTSATEGIAYQYDVSATDGSGALVLSATTIPTWLNFIDNSAGSGTLSGTPAAADVGVHSITIEVTDGTDIITQNFSITVSPAGTGGGGSASDLLFSEYVEGSSYNKAVEIANFTGSDASLSGYELKKQTNGSGSWSGGIALTGTLVDGDVYVLAHSSATAAVLGEADFTGSSTELNFNGNDALALFKNGTLIDAIGVFGSTDTYGANVTLRRNADVTSPNSNYSTSEWTSFTSDDFSDLGVHTMNVAPPNQAPTVSISSPANNSIFTTGNNFTITAIASDSDGSISNVEFFVNGNTIGTDASSPYQANYAATVGAMQIIAIATDNLGATTTSSTVNITGEDPVATGVLYFSEYIEGSSNNKALEIANTSGSTESLMGYEVKKQTNGAGSWSGGISLTGTVADGAVFVLANSSANADILSKADFVGGNSELTFNGNDAVGLFKEGTLIDIIGVFNDASVFAQNVTLRRNDIITTPNDTYSNSEWTTHATDNSTGLGLRFGEEIPNVSPAVSISSPSNGSNFTDGASVLISVAASDTDGTVSSVEFFIDGQSIGQDNSAPYSLSWTIGVGSYNITATATDNDGASTTSSSISITGEQSTPAEVVLSYDGFESGWGNFSDGGSDARRSTSSSRAFAGIGSANIQDNTNSSVITYTNGVDVTSFSQIRVDFNFLPISMENGEDFWLQVYDGSSYVTVETYTRGTDFQNNNFYFSSVLIDPSMVNFASNMKIRFRCDASGNKDDVYLDEITVTGINGGAARIGSREKVTVVREAALEEEFEKETKMSIYPNPVHEELSVLFEQKEVGIANIYLMDLNGKTIVETQRSLQEGKNIIKLDARGLEAGIYILTITAEDKSFTSRVIKK